MGWLLKKEGFVCQENLSTCNNSWRTVLSFRLPLSLRCVFDNKLTPFISGNGFGCNLMDSYFSLLNLSFVENYHRNELLRLRKNQWLIDFQIPLIVIARQPNDQRLWALVATQNRRILESHFKGEGPKIDLFVALWIKNAPTYREWRGGIPSKSVTYFGQKFCHCYKTKFQFFWTQVFGEGLLKGVWGGTN